MADPTTPSLIHPRKLDALTGLRAIAALAVFVHHFGHIFDTVFIRGPIGGIAVSFFFVLSGFILTYVYHQSLKPSKVKRFYFTRFARIWPLHAAILLLMLAVPTVSASDTTWPMLRMLSHWSLMQTWWPHPDWLVGGNVVAWSISVEAFFYAMFPLLLFGGRKQFWWKYAIIALGTLAGIYGVCFWMGPSAMAAATHSETWRPQEVVHFFPLFRLLEFATGMATGFVFLTTQQRNATRTQSGTHPWIGFAWHTTVEVAALALACGAWFALKKFGAFRFTYQLSLIGPVLTFWLSMSGGFLFHAIAIFVLARSRGLLGRILSSRLMVYLGEISFAFYMIHMPVCRVIFDKFWFESNFSPAFLGLVTLSVCIAISAVLYELIEIPSKQFLLALNARRKKSTLQTTLGKMLRTWLVSPVQEMLGDRRKLTMILVLFLAPIIATKLLKRADRKSLTVEEVMLHSQLEAESIQYGEHATLMAFWVAPRNGGAKFCTVWKFDLPCTLIQRFHFEGSTHEDRRAIVHCTAEQVGKPILVPPFVYAGKYEEADLVTLSIAEDDQLLPISQNRNEQSSDAFSVTAKQKLVVLSNEQGIKNAANTISSNKAKLR